MISNKKVQELYDIHTRHIPRDTKHLWEAENLDDILDIIKLIKPNVYMLVKCCTDWELTLQLATFEIVRRVRLNLLSIIDCNEIINILENVWIEYRKTSYLCLNSDFSETFKCKIQKRMKILYNTLFKLNQIRLNILNNKLINIKEQYNKI